MEGKWNLGFLGKGGSKSSSEKAALRINSAPARRSPCRVNSISSACGMAFGEMGLRVSIIKFLSVDDALRMEEVSRGMFLPDIYFADVFTRHLQCCELVAPSRRTSTGSRGTNVAWKLVVNDGAGQGQGQGPSTPAAAPLALLNRRWIFKQLHRLLSMSASNGEERALPRPAPAQRFQFSAEVLGCSSVDRAEEGPRRVLYYSRCVSQIEAFKIRSANSSSRLSSGFAQLAAQISIRAQIVCNCIAGSPCYWSSAPSPISSALKEWIDFYLMWPHAPKQHYNGRPRAVDETPGLEALHPGGALPPAAALLSSFAVRAYQSHGQPNAPIFAPLSVTLQLIICDDANGVRLSDGAKCGEKKRPRGEGDTSGSDKDRGRDSDSDDDNDSCGGFVYYEETFDFQHDASSQTFELSRAALVFPTVIADEPTFPAEYQHRPSPRAKGGGGGGGATGQVDPEGTGTGTKIRLRLNGAYQRQTLNIGDVDEHANLANLNHYYVCLSRVAFFGYCSPSGELDASVPTQVVRSYACAAATAAATAPLPSPGSEERVGQGKQPQKAGEAQLHIHTTR